MYFTMLLILKCAQYNTSIERSVEQGTAGVLELRLSQKRFLVVKSYDVKFKLGLI
jgi:hypothetical protein